jgi:small subunit ribosomal protein S3
MIERKFVNDNVKEFRIQEFVTATLKNVGHSHTKMIRTPLGEKIIIFASRPGLVVGKKGENIKKLTTALKKKFKLENPQIEISEVESPNLDAQIVAERIASTLERFGAKKFKAIGHRMISDVMNAGAMGVEIVISGKVPSKRAKKWRFYKGYMKKCGDIAINGVRHAYAWSNLKTGLVGVKVSIMHPDLRIPDDIKILDEMHTTIVEEEAPKKKVKKKKKTTKKKKVKKEVKVEEAK